MQKIDLINASKLSKAQKEELKKKITPYVKGKAHVKSINIPLKGIKVNCDYQSTGPSININHVEETKAEKNTTKKTEKKTEKKPDDLAKLEALIDSGEVVKNKNWYTFNGKNHNGLKNILKAIS